MWWGRPVEPRKHRRRNKRRSECPPDGPPQSVDRESRRETDLRCLGERFGYG